MIKLSQAHIIGTVISFLIGIFIVPLVIVISKKQGLVDMPNERKIHSTPIPNPMLISSLLSFFIKLNIARAYIKLNKI